MIKKILFFMMFNVSCMFAMNDKMAMVKRIEVKSKSEHKAAQEKYQIPTKQRTIFDVVPAFKQFPKDICDNIISAYIGIDPDNGPLWAHSLGQSTKIARENNFKPQMPYPTIDSRNVPGHIEDHINEMDKFKNSYDGNKMVTMATNGTAIVWEKRTHRVICYLAGHTSFIWAADFSHDGTKLATAGIDKKVVLWDIVTGEKLKEWPGDGGNYGIEGVRFSPLGSLLLILSAGNKLILLDVASGEKVTTISLPKDINPHYTSKFFIKNGKLIFKSSLATYEWESFLQDRPFTLPQQLLVWLIQDYAKNDGNPSLYAIAQKHGIDGEELRKIFASLDESVQDLIKKIYNLQAPSSCCVIS